MRSDGSTDGRSLTRALALDEHYNLPLELPPPWRSKSRTWTQAQLARERYEFFETRITGRPEVWAALKEVCGLVRQGDRSTAQGILDAAGVTLPTGNLLEGCYDEVGNLYRIPDVVLSDPTNIINDEDTLHPDHSTHRYSGSDVVDEVKGATLGVDETRASIEDDDGGDDNNDNEASHTVGAQHKRRDEKGKAIADRDAVKVKCRLSDRGGPDVVVMLGRSQTVGTLAHMVRADVDVPSAASIRIAYLGHILDETLPLTEQGWKEGHVVNALVIGFTGPA